MLCADRTVWEEQVHPVMKTWNVYSFILFNVFYFIFIFWILIYEFRLGGKRGQEFYQIFKKSRATFPK
jgi:hypothetical protein